MRELRESLVARARAMDRREPDLPAYVRVVEARAAIIDLLEGEHAGEVVASPLDRATQEVVGAMTLLLAIRESAQEDEAEEDDVRPSPDFLEARDALAGELLAFQALPLEARIRALVSEPQTVTLCAGAVVAFGVAWDPLADDPESDALAALVAGLAIVRAMVLLGDAAAGEAPPRLFAAIDIAAAAVGALDDEERLALLDGQGAVAWRVRGAAAAAFPSDTWSTIVATAGGLPVAFAAGAFGRDWLGDLAEASLRMPGELDDEGQGEGPIDDEDIAEKFREHADRLEAVMREIEPDQLRSTLEHDPVLAAFAAGRSWRAAAGEADWRAPWELASGG